MKAAISWKLVKTIDNKCEDGRFPVSTNCVTNPDSLSSNETEINPGIRSWKSSYPNELDVRKPSVVSVSQNIWRAKTLQSYLEFDNLKPRLDSCIFKSISGMNGSIFEGDVPGCLKVGVEIYILTPIRLLPCQFFSVFISIVYVETGMLVLLDTTIYYPQIT